MAGDAGGGAAAVGEHPSVIAGASGISASPPTQRRRIALFVCFGASILLAFPQPLAGSVLNLGIIAAPLAAAFFILALDGLTPRKAAKQAFFGSLAAHFVFFHWFYVVTVSYGHAPPILGALSPLAPGLYIGLAFALFGAVWARLRQSGLGSPLAAALLWTALEHLRHFLFGGFPWATLGYSQYLNPGLMGLAPWTGVHGLAFAVALCGAALAQWWREGAARPSRPVVVALGAVGLLHLPGLFAFLPDDFDESLKVAAIQGNIDQGQKWRPDLAEEILAIYIDLSRRAIEEGSRVIVWPETAVPGFLELQREISVPVSALARENSVSLVVGATGMELDDGGREIRHVFDSAFLIGPEGEAVARYDKTHRVPFGEYVPLRGLIGWFFQAIATGLSSSDIQPGMEPQSHSLPVSAISGSTLGKPGGSPQSVMIGAPICYELLFPDLVRRFTRGGARVLFAITNDAWYGRTGAPYQFLAMTALRAAESRLWVVRAANSGVSAIIDPMGRIRLQSGIFVRDVLTHDVPLAPADRRETFYVRAGDWFAYACWVGVGLLLIRSVGRERERVDDPGGFGK